MKNSRDGCKLIEVNLKFLDSAVISATIWGVAAIISVVMCSLCLYVIYKSRKIKVIYRSILLFLIAAELVNSAIGLPMLSFLAGRYKSASCRLYMRLVPAVISLILNLNSSGLAILSVNIHFQIVRPRSKLLFSPIQWYLIMAGAAIFSIVTAALQYVFQPIGITHIIIALVSIIVHLRTLLVVRRKKSEITVMASQNSKSKNTIEDGMSKTNTRGSKTCENLTVSESSVEICTETKCYDRCQNRKLDITFGHDQAWDEDLKEAIANSKSIQKDKVESRVYETVRDYLSDPLKIESIGEQTCSNFSNFETSNSKCEAQRNCSTSNNNNDDGIGNPNDNYNDKDNNVGCIKDVNGNANENEPKHKLHVTGRNNSGRQRKLSVTLNTELAEIVQDNKREVKVDVKNECQSKVVQANKKGAQCSQVAAVANKRYRKIIKLMSLFAICSILFHLMPSLVVAVCIQIQGYEKVSQIASKLFLFLPVVHMILYITINEEAQRHVKVICSK